MSETAILDAATEQNLRDAGCDEAFIAQFSGLSGHTDKERLDLLARHRDVLLESYYVYKQRIDRLDYLIYKIKKAE